MQQQLAQLQKQVAKNKKMVEKVETARSQGDQFLAKYFTDRRVVTSTIQGELVQIAKEAGITYQPTTWTPELIEGSDTLDMMTINAGCQGTYAALSKFVNLVDKSPRFLIIESHERRAAADRADPERDHEGGHLREGAGTWRRRPGGCRSRTAAPDCARRATPTSRPATGAGSMKLGAENKKTVYRLGLLGVGAAISVYVNFFSDSSSRGAAETGRRRRARSRRR